MSGEPPGHRVAVHVACGLGKFVPAYRDAGHRVAVKNAGRLVNIEPDYRDEQPLVVCYLGF